MGLFTAETPGTPRGIKRTLTHDLREKVVYNVTGNDAQLRRLADQMGWTRQETMEMLFRESWDFETVCQACDALNIRVQLTFAV